ncbi:predicted protein [Chaetoceros tenuissimus]|uniref:Uncharacterized protein n=1 Tax=Chaetoceros tenuissimus TaxID=426638 RepID=A0AAD3H549_9STRA|nr:predicted protein [Chaetoceros tenuissimus]
MTAVAGQTYTNARLVIDPEGIDAPRLPEEERKRRQEEIIRQAYLRRSSTRSSYHRQRSIDESMFRVRDSVPKQALSSTK